jgi:1,4-alpha-glucan branching enzyme
MPGDQWQRMANLRALFAWMWAHPGRPLLFMGDELAQDNEWSHERSLDWQLLQYADHAGVHALVRSLNVLAERHRALWELDFDAAGFRWIDANDANDADQNVLSFLRVDSGGTDAVACIANLSPVVRQGYRVGLPSGGEWVEILSTDAAEFGGGGAVNGVLVASDRSWHGLDHSVELTLPPLGVVWLARLT